MHELLLDRSSVGSLNKTKLLLEDTIAALTRVTTLCNLALKEAKEGEKSLIAGQSIAALPDDILSIISEQLSNLEDDDQSLIRFSHVCRRFRDVALSTSGAWSSISSTYCERKNDTFLSRSKTSGLDISLFYNDEDAVNIYKDFITLVSAHSARWRSFRFHVDVKHNDDLESLGGLTRWLGMACRGLELTMVCKLQISYTANLSTLGHRIAEHGLHFYTFWDMPNLQTLHADNFIPRPLSAKSLKAFRFKMSRRIYDEWHDLKPLVRFLESCDGLEDLTLDLDGIHHSEALSHATNLQRVKKACISFKSGDNDLGTLRNLLGAISLPNVTELTACTKVRQWNDVGRWLNCLLNEKNTFSKLERLDICASRWQYEGCGVATVFKLHPWLSHLSIHLRDLRDEEGDHPYDIWGKRTLVEPTQLKYLRFKGCKGFDCYPVVQVLEDIAYSAGWDGFQRMDVVNCPSFRKSLFEGKIPDSKISWIDN